MNLVAIVGRPNVGKSTLFNRMVGSKEAIVESTPGVTRDRIFGESDWSGKYFTIIDTGGFIPGSENQMEKAIREQANIAMEDADVILYVCDGRDGLTAFDYDIAEILRRAKKPIVLAVNKCDNAMQDANSFEFHSLGLGEPFPISALSGRNTGELMDAITSHMTDADKLVIDPRLKIAIVGRPNAGKSSLTNALLGVDRMIVTDIPGTTRDSIDSVVKYYNEEIVLIDTAGLRKKSQIKENIEMYSIIRTTRAIERCDVAIVMIDAERGLEDQDKKIINQVDESRKGILIAVNKWDLVEKDHKTADNFVNEFYTSMKTYDYLPILFISAVTKQRITKVLEYAKKIKERRETRISTSKLNQAILPELDKTPPPSVLGRDLRINYVTQVRAEPPIFAFFCNFPQLIPDSYKRFIERTIRDHFDLTGTPISLLFKKKSISNREKDND